MNSVIIPQLPPARVPGGYPGYGYGVPAQGYLSYTPAQQKFAAAAGFPPATQQHQPTTPTTTQKPDRTTTQQADQLATQGFPGEKQ